MADEQRHESIWLQPWCDGCDKQCWGSDGRQWCENDAWSGCEGCERQSVKYVLADSHASLKERLEFAEFEWNRATEGMQERDARIATLENARDVLESNARVQAKLLADTGRTVEALTTALKSVSAQCANVIFNCEQRPADNQRHLDSWRGVKEFADAARPKQEPGA